MYANWPIQCMEMQVSTTLIQGINMLWLYFGCCLVVIFVVNICSVIDEMVCLMLSAGL